MYYRDRDWIQRLSLKREIVRCNRIAATLTHFEALPSTTHKKTKQNKKTTVWGTRTLQLQPAKHCYQVETVETFQQFKVFCHAFYIQPIVNCLVWACEPKPDTTWTLHWYSVSASCLIFIMRSWKDAGVSLTGVLELQRLLYNIHLIKKTDMIYINLSFKSTLCLICSESIEPCE